MNSDKKSVILAPAGSVEQLVAAVNNGCDAVYLGLEEFNARMKAPNFTAENIGRWVNFCHFFGVKVYVTVNTSVKNGEFQRAVETLLVAYNNGADGAIITDLALLKYAATLPKPFEVVASTQLNIHDGYGAQFARSLGADTVVCARESTFAEIEQIANTGVVVESFLHGAVCVCQSGQCLLSSVVGGNSGNRGLCAQPCRRLYKSNAGKFVDGGYLLSAADVCSLDTAQRLEECGVSAFKIEGRNRRAEYAGATSRVYSRLFANGFHAEAGDFDLLCEMFNRGGLPSNAYLTGNNGRVIYPYQQNHIGVAVGKVRKNGVLCEVPLQKGDGLKVLDGQREVCGGMVLQDGSTGIVAAEFSGSVRDGMTVRRTSSEMLCADILSARRKHNVCVRLSAFAGQKAQLQLTSCGTTVTVESSETVQKALNKPTSQEELRLQLEKIGDLPYKICDISVSCDEIFMAKSQINALRRSGFEALTNAIVACASKAFVGRSLPQYTSLAVNRSAQNCLAVVCKTRDELRMAAPSAQYLIYKPEELTAESLEGISEHCFVDLPSFSDNLYISKLWKSRNFGVVCHNVGQVEMARQHKLPYIAGLGLNIFNDEIAAIFADAETFFYSAELSLDEIARFSDKSGIVYVDGELVLMKMVHCPYKTVFGCDCITCKRSANLQYTDELGNVFKIARRKDSRCTFELLNGKKLSVGGKLQQGGRYCVCFDKNVVAHFVALNNNQKDNYTEQAPYTKGRLFNKIN